MFSSTVTVRPAKAEREPKVGAEGGTTAAGLAVGGVPGLGLQGAPAKGGDPKEDPKVPP